MPLPETAPLPATTKKEDQAHVMLVYGKPYRSPMPTNRHQRASRLFIVSAVVSVALAVILTVLYFVYDSKLTLAQAADSTADMLTGLALLWALRVSAQPADEDHPFGHHSAQPIAALVVAVLACVLAVEVARDAIAALSGYASVQFDWLLVIALGTKVIMKAGLAAAASRGGNVGNASALKAFQVDARNDVLIGAVSVVGLLAAKWTNTPTLDAWLALPVAAWVGYSGASLAFESATILMGVAAPSQRTAELTALAAEVEGVSRIYQLKARHLGEHLRVWLEVHVEPQLSIGAAHDIGEAVEAALLQQEDVAEAVVHVDAADAAV